MPLETKEAPVSVLAFGYPSVRQIVPVAEEAAPLDEVVFWYPATEEVEVGVERVMVMSEVVAVFDRVTLLGVVADVVPFNVGELEVAAVAETEALLPAMFVYTDRASLPPQV